MQCRKRRLYADCGFFGVKAYREVVEHNVDDVVADFRRVVGVVGQRLVVGDKNVNLVKLAGVLELNAPFERAHIVTEVKPAGGAVAG